MTPAILVLAAMIAPAAWAYWGVAPGAEKSRCNGLCGAM